MKRIVMMTGIKQLVRWIKTKLGVGVPDLAKARRYGMKIGADPQFQPGSVIDLSHCWLIEVGDHFVMARGAILLAHDASTQPYLGFTRIGRIRIGNNVFVGDSAIILPGTTIGDDVIVGAGAVVTGDIPSRSVVAGVPAKVIMTLDEFLDRERAKMAGAPVFEESYTLRGGITPEKRAEMVARLTGKKGYVR